MVLEIILHKWSQNFKSMHDFNLNFQVFRLVLLQEVLDNLWVISLCLGIEGVVTLDA
jgi:hypothetical protein